MQKNDILSEIKLAAEKRLLTMAEIEDAYNEGMSVHGGNLEHKRVTVSDALYLIGGLIVIIGIGVLIGQNWYTLSPLVRVLSTLGSSIVALVVGFLLSKKSELVVWSTAFLLVASIVLPIGVYVTFDSFQLGTESIGTEALIAGLVLLSQLGLFVLWKKGIHLIFSLIYGVWFYYMVTAFLLGYDTYNYDRFNYLTLGLGTSLFFVGVAIARSTYQRLSGVVYAVATISFLAAAFGLQGFDPTASMFWEAIFPVLAFGLIFLSSELKSKSILVFSSIFLMAYILKLTGEYFQGSLGWPLALVVAGLLLMAVGYLAFTINKRYISRNSLVKS